MLQYLSYLPVVLAAVYYGLYYYFTRTFNYWKKLNVVGPKPVPFFGNIKESALRRKNIATLSKEYYNMFPSEPLVGLYRMTTPCLMIRDLDIVKNILIKDSDLFRDRGVEYSESGLGQNMFHANGDTWSALRTRFTPIFTSGKLKGMYYLLNECSDTFVNYLDKITRTKTEHDVRTFLRKYTMSTIATCAFGLNLTNFEDETEMDRTLEELDALIFTSNFATEVDMMYPGLLRKLNLSLFPAKVTQFFEKLVRDVMSQRHGKPSGRGDFMDLILQLRELGEITNTKSKQAENKLIEITEDIMASQAFIFFAAGYETSSSTMAHLLYQLAQNLEIQDKLREEVDTVTEAHGKARGEITYESIQDMKYLDKAFAETLRMHPFLDPLHRKADADYKIPGTDVVIKKDQTVLIPVLGIHYDKKYYPNPEVFDPNRFDPEAVSARHSCAYLPFGIGPRACIGTRFGSLQSRLGIAKIISKFHVEAGINTKTSFTLNPKRITLAPIEDIILNIRPRSD